MDFSFSELFGGISISIETVYRIIKAIIVLIITYGVARLLLFIIRRALLARLDRHEAQIIGKVVYYVVFIFGILIILNIFNVELSGILAAAGVLTVAISFAAQTTFSNLISGVFLYFDKPFEVGDTIEVEGQVGEILSIDILSTKLRTIENLYYRVPNSLLIEKPLINYTRFELRRINIIVGIGYEADLKKAKDILLKVMGDNEFILKEPTPSVYVDDFGASSVNMNIRCWTRRADYMDASSELKRELKDALDSEDIDIPYDHLVLHLDKTTSDVLKNK